MFEGSSVAVYCRKYGKRNITAAVSIAYSVAEADCKNIAIFFIITVTLT